jgi:hypothetical protein
MQIGSCIVKCKFHKRFGCQLCDKGFDSIEDRIAHWRDEHLQLPEHVKATLDDDRVEEAMLTRINSRNYLLFLPMTGKEMKERLAKLRTGPREAPAGMKSKNKAGDKQ